MSECLLISKLLTLFRPTSFFIEPEQRLNSLNRLKEVNLSIDENMKSKSTAKTHTMIQTKKYSLSKRFDENTPLILVSYTSDGSPQYLLGVKSIFEELFEDSNKVDDDIKNRLLRDTSLNHVPYILVLSAVKKSKDELYIEKIMPMKTVKQNKKDSVPKVKTPEDILEEHQAELELGRKYVCINVPEKSLKPAANRRAKGIKFIKEADWDEIKHKGDFAKGLFKEKIAAIDLHIETLKQKTPTRLERLSADSDLLLSTGTKDIIKHGGFKFVTMNEKDPEDFNIDTPFDEEIDKWISREIDPSFIKHLNRAHNLLHSEDEKGNKLFASFLSVQLTEGCRELFGSSLIEDIVNSYIGFTCCGEHKNADGIPDYSISLLHKGGVLRIPLIYAEEKSNKKKADEVCEQINGYCQE